MKQRNSLFEGKASLLSIVILFLSFSCQKTDRINKKADLAAKMDEVARLLHTEKRTGTLMSADNDESLALSYNNGEQYIMIDKLPGLADIELPSLFSAELITSSYGIVIRDASDNRIWLLANNDDESLRKFEAVRTLLKEDLKSLRVFGTTLVNPGRS
jgi:hypothetical protein